MGAGELVPEGRKAGQKRERMGGGKGEVGEKIEWELEGRTKTGIDIDMKGERSREGEKIKLPWA